MGLRPIKHVQILDHALNEVGTGFLLENRTHIGRVDMIGADQNCARLSARNIIFGLARLPWRRGGRADPSAREYLKPSAHDNHNIESGRLAVITDDEPNARRLEVWAFYADLGNAYVGAHSRLSRLPVGLYQTQRRRGVALSSGGGALSVLGRFPRFPSRSLGFEQRDAVATTSFVQRAFSLSQGPNQETKADGTQNSSHDSQADSAFSRFRRFLSSDHGAPLSAQICGIVGLGLVAGISIAFGIGPVGRFRRNRFYIGMLIASAILGLFGYWLSAA
jgi:hypothetical protein